eukprot:TRINITY_DN22549_c0_g1_i1.p1 TRINITY_DN22549_c0_g1~~TRINITY_DN22549_c0_g1_i1.p1  ORF type:complete len:135 (-),score=11.30 TRINITY_DN22549_c0_g1_i1:47-451(-)
MMKRKRDEAPDSPSNSLFGYLTSFFRGVPSTPTNFNTGNRNSRYHHERSGSVSSNHVNNNNVGSNNHLGSNSFHVPRKNSAPPSFITSAATPRDGGYNRYSHSSQKPNLPATQRGRPNAVHMEPFSTSVFKVLI